MEITEELQQLNRTYYEVENRATGRTTRKADSIIQQLFKNPDKWITVVDHYDSRQASKRLVDIIKRRLKIEHNAEIFCRPSQYGFDIKLTNYEKIKQIELEKIDLMIQIKKAIKKLYKNY